MYFSNLYPMSLTKKKTYSDTFSLFPHQHLLGQVCAYNPLDLETPVFRQRREKKKAINDTIFEETRPGKGFLKYFQMCKFLRPQLGRAELNLLPHTAYHVLFHVGKKKLYGNEPTRHMKKPARGSFPLPLP